MQMKNTEAERMKRGGMEKKIRLSHAIHLFNPLQKP